MPATDQTPAPKRGKPPRANRILVLSPHPDDEVLGCGGTLCYYASQGAHITVVYLQQAGRDAVQQELEAAAAVNCLGVASCHFCHGDVMVAQALLDSLLRESQPEIILLPSIAEIHPLHLEWQHIYCEVAAGHPDRRRLWLYEVWVPTPYNLLIDITPYAEQKRAALRCYGTQCRRYPLEELAFALGRAHGAACVRGVQYAEVFLELSSERLVDLADTWRYLQQICRWREEACS